MRVGGESIGLYGFRNESYTLSVEIRRKVDGARRRNVERGRGAGKGERAREERRGEGKKKEKKSQRGDTEDGFPLAFDRFH